MPTPSQRAIAADPDLDKGLYNKPIPPEVLSAGLRKKVYTPAGKTPAQIAAEQAAAAAAYLRYKNRPKPGKY